jgi:hypothetical protein
MTQLMFRSSAALRDTVLSNRDHNASIVSVWKAAGGDAFERTSEDRDTLEVFHHPYAYAALRGVNYGTAA